MRVRARLRPLREESRVVYEGEGEVVVRLGRYGTTQMLRTARLRLTRRLHRRLGERSAGEGEEEGGDVDAVGRLPTLRHNGTKTGTN